MSVSPCDQTHYPWAALALFFTFFTFFSPSMLDFSTFEYDSMNLATSSRFTTVESFFAPDRARIRQLYSAGVGRGGFPSRGFGRSCPSSAKMEGKEGNQSLGVFVGESLLHVQDTYIVLL